MNGKEGDDPVNDIVTYNLPVFAPDIDQLIREIASLGGFECLTTSSYVRAVHELLGWPLQLDRLSEHDKESIRRSYMSDFREILGRERDRLRGHAE